MRLHSQGAVVYKVKGTGLIVSRAQSLSDKPISLYIIYLEFLKEPVLSGEIVEEYLFDHELLLVGTEKKRCLVTSESSINTYLNRIG